MAKPRNIPVTIGVLASIDSKTEAVQANTTGDARGNNEETGLGLVNTVVATRGPGCNSFESQGAECRGDNNPNHNTSSNVSELSRVEVV